MNRITVALETLLRKSVGLAPRGADCCNATPEVPGECDSNTEAPLAVADAEPPATTCCGGR